jgi:hypothetical protein
VKNPVNPRIPQYFHAFSTSGKAIGMAAGEHRRSRSRFLIEAFSPIQNDSAFRGGGSLQHATVWPSAWNLQSADKWAQAF